jgi:uncharacterized metal-binding protein YceD (DUF177 family)
VFFDLEKLPPEGEALDLSVPGGDLPTEGEDFRMASDVDIRGRIQCADSDENGAYRLAGAMSCRIEVPCVRCLEPFVMDVRESLDLLYLPQPQPQPQPKPQAQAQAQAQAAPQTKGPGRGEPASRREAVEDRGLEADDLAASFYEDEHIDLGQMILEQIVLALPMKPLCQVDCRGLCPECGANRNTVDCECATDDTDPRWATLKTLLGR